MKDVFNCLFSGLLVAVDVPVYPNHLLLFKVSQIVGPPTFLWDWQKFAFCQSYV
jgi:hypothetical protein